MSPLNWRHLAVLAILSAATGANAQTVGYAAGYDTLYRVALESGAATSVGKFGSVGSGAGLVPIADVEGLAFAPGGELYAVSDARDLLIRVDTATGQATVVGSLGLRGQGGNQFNNLDFGLAFTCDGRLWLSSDVSRQLWRVDPATGATTLVGNIDQPISGLASWNGELYGVGVADRHNVYRIDAATAQATLVGHLGTAFTVYDAGADFDAQGRLWITLDSLAPPEGLPSVYQEDLVRVDIANGATLDTRLITGIGSGINIVQMEALAIAPPSCGNGGGTAAANPVPVQSPWMLWLMALALAGLGISSLRRVARA
jgi:hypothetical protein